MYNSQTLTLSSVNGGKPFVIYYEIDRFIKEVLIDGEYNKVFNLTPIKDKTDLVCIDLGCNIGTFSLSIYDRCKEIHAVDLSTKCIEILNQTIRDNNFNKIKTYNTAIAGENKIVHTTSLTVTDGGNSIYGGNGNDMQAYTLAQFIKNNAIDYVDLVKIDVECAEGEILSAADFVNVKDKIGTIVGEVHGGQDLSSIFSRYNWAFSVMSPHFVAYPR